MKRIISLTLVLLMLAALTLTAVSCDFGMEGITGYTRLREHILGKPKDSEALDESGSSYIKAVTLEGEDTPVLQATIQGQTQKEILLVSLTMDGSVEKVHLDYVVINLATGDFVSGATAEVLLTHYTGDDLIAFNETEKMGTTELAHREYATTLLNTLLYALDNYTTEHLDMTVRELGFIALSDKYMADVETQETVEDLGGAFSAARLKKAGLMLLQGMGMVFLVLAILWIVLLIFKAIFYKEGASAEKAAKKAAKETAKAEKEAAKAEKETAKAAPAPVPAVTAPVADDGQLIAVITAAVAAAIESDPALTSQFASGFRVVSFKKTDKSRNR